MEDTSSYDASRKINNLGIAAHAFTPSIAEAETGESSRIVGYYIDSVTKATTKKHKLRKKPLGL